jgi:hypothetical protein
MKKVIDEFVEQKQMFMKKFKNIKSIHRCVSKKGVFTTVILNDDRKKTVKLCDGDVDDFEKSVLWAYALVIGQKNKAEQLSLSEWLNSVYYRRG